MELGKGAQKPTLGRLQGRINQERSQKTADKKIQPTLRSFIGLKSGLEGSRKAAKKETTSDPGNTDVVGKRPQHFLETEDSWRFGLERSKAVLKGSPEHLLLKEAKILSQGGRTSPVRK